MNEALMTVGTHIAFVYLGVLSGQKTGRWEVVSKYTDDGRLDSGPPLGEIKWFSRWRKYSFFPADGCIFEEVCMREISDFIVERTKIHKIKAEPPVGIVQPATLESEHDPRNGNMPKPFAVPDTIGCNLPFERVPTCENDPGTIPKNDN